MFGVLCSVCTVAVSHCDRRLDESFTDALTIDVCTSWAACVRQNCFPNRALVAREQFSNFDFSVCTFTCSLSCYENGTTATENYDTVIIKKNPLLSSSRIIGNTNFLVIDTWH